MLLTGTFFRTVDEKCRIAVPREVRDAFFLGAEAVAYLAPGTDGSLDLYPESAFVKLADRLAGVSPAQQDVRAFSRLFYAQANRVQFDGQGRIRLPLELMQLAGLARDVVLLGVRDHLEIWDRRRWEQYRSEKQSHYDDIAESALAQPNT